MRDQELLDFGGVDVHTAGNDQVGAAVEQEQVAVLVEVSDVADGGEISPAARGRR
jgi:hypothetical protein